MHNLIIRFLSNKILGPVLCVFKFNDIDEAIRRSNATNYGLGAGVFTRDINEAIKISNALNAGCVYVNCFEAVFNT